MMVVLHGLSLMVVLRPDRNPVCSRISSSFALEKRRGDALSRVGCNGSQLRLRLRHCNDAFCFCLWNMVDWFGRSFARRRMVFLVRGLVCIRFLFACRLPFLFFIGFLL